MPELPEVEVLARHLRPALCGKVVQSVEVRRLKVVRPTSSAELQRALKGARFESISRRGKYLLFELRPANRGKNFQMLGHLGMTGRMFVASSADSLPKHAAVLLALNRGRFVYEDTRYFGRLTLDLSALDQLGPEPLSDEFSVPGFAAALQRSGQGIKVKLLDQSVVAGVGNIYASEALFRARIHPAKASNQITMAEVKRLHRAIRKVLAEAIDCGSTIPLNFSGGKKSDGLFYFGRQPGAEDYYEERLLVYDRAGKPCAKCSAPIKRIVQAARSTFFCPHCQPVNA